MGRAPRQGYSVPGVSHCLTLLPIGPPELACGALQAVSALCKAQDSAHKSGTSLSEGLYVWNNSNLGRGDRGRVPSKVVSSSASIRASYLANNLRVADTRPLFSTPLDGIKAIPIMIFLPIRVIGSCSIYSGFQLVLAEL